MKYDAQLKEIVKNNNDLMAILHILRDLDLNDWAIGAGMLRDVVWSHLHGVEVSNFRDIDVVYFDLRADKKKDDRIEEFCIIKCPSIHGMLRTRHLFMNGIQISLDLK